MTRIAYAFLTLLLLTIAASAQHVSTVAPGFIGGQEYWHNGSLMSINWYGDIVEIVYKQPRYGLIPLGVRPGTVLFEGYLSENGAIEGSASVFSNCYGEMRYWVTGGYETGGVLHLRGPTPVVDQTTCVCSWRYSGGNADLYFLP